MDKRFERDYQDGLDSLRFSGEAKGRMAEHLLEQEGPAAGKGRRFRPMRPAVIAACLCLALVGTAGAAGLIAGFHRIEPIGRFYDDHTDRFYQGYTAWGGVDFIPLERLSPEILELAAENPALTVSLPVSSREELEELTGLELPNRVALDGLVPRHFSAVMSADSVGPTYIDYMEFYRYPAEGGQTLWVQVAACLVTERMAGLEVASGSVFPVEYATESEEYTAENGLSAIVTRVMVPQDDPRLETDEYEAVFALDGAWYRVGVRYMEHSEEEALAVLKQVLDGFVV